MRPISCQKANKQTNKKQTQHLQNQKCLALVKSGIDSELGFCQVNIMKGEKARAMRAYARKELSDGPGDLSCWVKNKMMLLQVEICKNSEKSTRVHKLVILVNPKICWS